MAVGETDRRTATRRREPPSERVTRARRSRGTQDDSIGDGQHVVNHGTALRVE